ncbi:tripartite-type tricarboxylate transporter receptor subunit TctC [Agrobacterium larrymoorei]|uniref:Tripartite-type tricarboxylate transporter receptor subunit TctC n=1 Tax=Agrobacterium larrymoorei TaxID=160699 RepID=A0ABU0UG34_9HYPH|nr:tripartite-type tricarboxylate transporter receptor subunit TctC [Agrobacterium larrymoorei]
MEIVSLKRRAALMLAASAAALLSFSAGAYAQAYPERTITLVVPFAAGGSTDVVARVIAQKMGDALGQQIVVENVAGAGGNLGADRVARAEPDGYTILMGTVATHALNPLILKTKPYDPEKDFAPISLLVVVPNVLVINPQLPVNTVAELIALLKKEPDKHAYASSGNGTPLHLSGELFKTMAGVDMQHVPYKGSGPALNDLLGNQISIMFDNLPSSSAHIKSGTLKALGVTTAERASSFPDVPTIAETVPGYETYTWNALSHRLERRLRRSPS